MPFTATWMQREILTLSELSRKEKGKYHMIALICGIENMTQMNLSTQQKQTQRHRERILTCGCQGVGAGRGKGAGWAGSLELAAANSYI